MRAAERESIREKLKCVLERCFGEISLSETLNKGSLETDGVYKLIAQCRGYT